MFSEYQSRGISIFPQTFLIKNMEVCLYIYMYVYTYMCMRVGIECISMLNKTKTIFKV